MATHPGGDVKQSTRLIGPDDLVSRIDHVVAGCHAEDHGTEHANICV